MIGTQADALCIIVIIVSGNHPQISFKPSEVSLSCNRKAARILSVPKKSDVEPKNLFRKHSLSFYP